MKKEYDTFVTSPDKLPQGQEVSLLVRDLTPGPRKYDSSWVKAIVSSSSDELPESDVLWLRSPIGFLYPTPWAIKILAVLGEYMPR